MGLTTSHGCWNGPYSSFNRFRKCLANQIGIDLDDYIGYGNPNATKSLDSIQHGIMPLLNHSDCEGHIGIRDLRKIEKGLKDILDNFDSTLESANEYNLVFRIEKFREGCLDAISKKEKVIFS